MCNRWNYVLFVTALLSACGDDSTPGPRDSGPGGRDGGTRDAGPPRIDGGGSDGGGSDGGGTDGGGDDAGTTDAGVDAGMCVPAMGSCAMGERCCDGLECCAGVPVPPGAEFCGVICPISDRNAKQDFEAIDRQAILERVATLPISEWSYHREIEAGGVRHIGPMAQDFQAAFGIGPSDRHINPLDASGVSLAAIQALNENLTELERENRELENTIERLERRLRALEQSEGATACEP